MQWILGTKPFFTFSSRTLQFIFMGTAVIDAERSCCLHLQRTWCKTLFENKSTRERREQKFERHSLLVNVRCYRVPVPKSVVYSPILFLIKSRLMHGSSYIWGFLVPACILLFVGFYLSAQLSGAVKLTAALQIDQRARNKIIKRRGLQIGLFFKVSLSSPLPVCYRFLH